MKNYLKITAVVTMLCLISCDKEDDSTKTEQEDLFNLKVGRNWVYKNYNGDSLQNIRFSNSFDSVVLTDKFTFENKNYFKRETFYKNLNIGSWQWRSVNYIYVNPKGHLITFGKDPREDNDQKEHTIHPGVDKDFIHNEEVIFGGESYGTVVYKLEANRTINVEGTDYLSYPFVGRLQPNEKIPKERITEYHYAKGIGMVKEVLAAIYGDATWERHLVSYSN
ncbi:hypothetical protein [Paenimyroides baculatum]|uniref:Uncharacterized protein n=1 Tax=Paenimyroides baculatum TaxID=2608000 RepID=A0A5M6CIZ7_9FLAO|nr:hypothetical protein [Paenimyroides baculatum]KAA5533922.1 hypothetical protein F0460_11350 [Paenimyroides baculatum]